MRSLALLALAANAGLAADIGSFGLCDPGPEGNRETCDVNAPADCARWLRMPRHPKQQPEHHYRNQR